MSSTHRSVSTKSLLFDTSQWGKNGVNNDGLRLSHGGLRLSPYFKLSCILTIRVYLLCILITDATDK